MSGPARSTKTLKLWSLAETDVVPLIITEPTDLIDNWPTNPGLLFCDTETTGLDPNKDKLKQVQIFHLETNTLLIVRGEALIEAYKYLLNTPTLVFHNVIFDISFLAQLDEYPISPTILRHPDIRCTKLLAKLHLYKKTGLRSLAAEILRIDLPKSNDIATCGWENDILTNEQIEYASGDVIVLADIYKELEKHISAQAWDAYNELISNLSILHRLYIMGILSIITYKGELELDIFDSFYAQNIISKTTLC